MRCARDRHWSARGLSRAQSFRCPFTSPTRFSQCGKPISYVSSIIRQSQTPIFDILPFFGALLEAHALRLKHDYAAARTHFEALNALMPYSEHVLHHLAVMSMQDGFAIEANELFKRLRELDPFYVDGMDTYGSIVKLRGTSRALRALAIDLFSIDSTRPEPWCVAAMHAELEGDRPRALQLVDKAIALDSDARVFPICCAAR
jgi:tetratricopeptide (TPR) repeat protein